MASGGLRTNLLLNDDVEKHVRGVYKLRLVRKQIDALQHHLQKAQAQVAVCQQNEALALQRLQSAGCDKAIYEFSRLGNLFSTDCATDLSPSTPSWHLEKIADLTVYQQIEDRLAKDMEPFRTAERRNREAHQKAFESTKQANFAVQQITLELLINENKLAVLTSQTLDRETAKWQRTVLKWLIFANECFADRLDMDVFPTPPEAPCMGDCPKFSSRKLHVCDCSVKAAFVYIDGLDLGYDLRSERRRWHPEQFMACDMEDRKAFCEMADEVFTVVDALWQRKRSGLCLAIELDLADRLAFARVRLQNAEDRLDRLEICNSEQWKDYVFFVQKRLVIKQYVEVEAEGPLRALEQAEKYRRWWWTGIVNAPVLVQCEKEAMLERDSDDDGDWLPEEE